MSKESSKTVNAYKYTLKGRYVAYTDKGKTTKFYRDVVVTLPEHVIYREGFNKVKVKNAKGNEEVVYWPRVIRYPVKHGNVARSYIRKFLIVDALTGAYEDFAGVKTINIVSIAPVKVSADQPNVRDFTKVKVKDFTLPELQNCLTLTGGEERVHLQGYEDLLDKIEAVTEWLSSQRLLDREGYFILPGVKGKRGTIEEFRDARVSGHIGPSNDFGTYHETPEDTPVLQDFEPDIQEVEEGEDSASTLL